MPNQRKAGKKLLASWIAEGNLEALKNEAERRGMTTAEFLEELINKETNKIERTMDGNRDNKK